jgi:RNA-directed DNA polymerase
MDTSTVIGAREPLTDWVSIDWKTVEKRIKNLRRRIYRASQSGQWKKVRSLMKLMLRSYSNLLQSIRRVAQLNQGKRTPGLDGQTALTPAERVKLVQQMMEHTVWKAKPAKRIYIPKANGGRRPLGIPTLKNRVAQAIVKNALEPRFESQFEAHSYGFRPGRSCHDAIEQVWTRLNSSGNRDKWVLDADIKGAFDNISHEFIMTAIGGSPGRELIKQWLKAGYVDKGVFHSTDMGTPQGSPISPLLANIALDGLEKLLFSYKTKSEPKVIKSGKCKGKTRRSTRNTYGFIRYADDFLVTDQNPEDLEKIIPVIEKWLSQRGLTLNKEKTRITNVDEGVNFLGFHVRKFKNKCLVQPQKSKVLAFLQELRDWLKKNAQATQEVVIRYLNPRIRGFGNYYRNVCSKRVFSYIDHKIWDMLWKWALRRHNKRRLKWVKKKYFRSIEGRDWIFSVKTQDRRGKLTLLRLESMSKIEIIRHVKVKDKASPDDPNLKKYWDDRATKYGKSIWAKGSRNYRIAQNQNWMCPSCGEHLFNGENVETHHVTSVAEGGKDIIDNLLHLHKNCHQQIHNGSRKVNTEARAE